MVLFPLIVTGVLVGILARYLALRRKYGSITNGVQENSRKQREIDGSNLDVERDFEDQAIKNSIDLLRDLSIESSRRSSIDGDELSNDNLLVDNLLKLFEFLDTKLQNSPDYLDEIDNDKELKLNTNFLIIKQYLLPLEESNIADLSEHKKNLITLLNQFLVFRDFLSNNVFGNDLKIINKIYPNIADDINRKIEYLDNEIKKLYVIEENGVDKNDKDESQEDFLDTEKDKVDMAHGASLLGLTSAQLSQLSTLSATNQNDVSDEENNDIDEKEEAKIFAMQNENSEQRRFSTATPQFSTTKRPSIADSFAQLITGSDLKSMKADNVITEENEDAIVNEIKNEKASKMLSEVDKKTKTKIFTEKIDLRIYSLFERIKRIIDTNQSSGINMSELKGSDEDFQAIKGFLQVCTDVTLDDELDIIQQFKEIVCLLETRILNKQKSNDYKPYKNNVFMHMFFDELRNDAECVRKGIITIERAKRKGVQNNEQDIKSSNLTIDNANDVFASQKLVDVV